MALTISQESGNEKLQKNKEQLSALLQTRQTKDTLVQQGILSSTTFGAQLEGLPHERGVPVFLVRVVTYLELKARDIDKLFNEPVDINNVTSAKQAVQSGKLYFPLFANSTKEI